MSLPRRAEGQDFNQRRSRGRPPGRADKEAA